MFKGHLYPFQEIGVEKLSTSSYYLLGDNVGLGKTIQSLAAVEKKHFNQYIFQRTLIVCPNTIVKQWAEKINEFTDSNFVIITGTTIPATPVVKAFPRKFRREISDFFILD